MNIVLPAGQKVFASCSNVILLTLNRFLRLDNLLSILSFEILVQVMLPVNTMLLHHAIQAKALLRRKLIQTVKAVAKQGPEVITVEVKLVLTTAMKKTEKVVHIIVMKKRSMTVVVEKGKMMKIYPPSCEQGFMYGLCYI